VSAIGYAMLAAPFAAIFGFSCATLGLADTLRVFGLTALTMVWIALGSYLVSRA